jgi:hypothetical protein
MSSDEIELPDETARAREAHGLYLMGLEWSEIAQRVGYKNADSARITTKQVLQRAALNLDQERLDEMLNTELERLNLLQAAAWPMALAGDTRSIDIVLKVMNTRHKLLGFDKREEKVTNQTLVVSGDNFIEILQQAVENREKGSIG